MRIILLMGTSSVGKSTLCSALKAGYEFHIVKNGDEYFDDYLAGKKEELKATGIMDKLSPFMRPDEIMRFCVSEQLNIASAPTPLVDVKIEDNAALDAHLIIAGYDEEQRLTIATNLKLAKEVFDANPGPTYEASLERSQSEALDIANRDKTVVIDFVPESTPAKTREILDDFTERAKKFGKDNAIEVEVAQVLIYCPMKKLSENMAARNQRAEETHNIMDKRVGINPILMLSSVATAETESAMEPELMRISREELLDIVAIAESVPKEQVSDQYAKLIGSGDGQWSYGFRFPDKVEEVTLRIPKELRFDCTLNNTGNISPAKLAEEMVTKLGFGVDSLEAELKSAPATLEPSELAELSSDDSLAARETMQKFRQAMPQNTESEEEVKKDETAKTPLPTKPKIPGLD